MEKFQGFIQENQGIVNQTFINQVSELFDRPVSVVKTELTKDEYRQRTALLSKVKDYWVKGVLEKSLYNEAMIELGLEERSDIVEDEHPFIVVEESPEDARKILPIGTNVTDFFNQIGDGRTLLILGEPGSGKTIALLKLAQNLIVRAEENISQQLMPVVFNLSSWKIKEQKIADWLVEELLNKYGVPKTFGKNWIEKQELILLLDGLDEVKAERREACVEAINNFLQKYGLTEVVVCSRITEYEALSVHLQLRGAIFLRSLTPDQINQYLDKVGHELQAVKTLLKEDNELQELAKSPLTLSVMTVAYRGKKVEELPQTGSVEERRQHLFNTYIKRMFSHEQIGKAREYKAPYQNRQSILWLTWLAQHMTKESQTVFLIENLQPKYLKTNLQKLLYVQTFSLFIFLVVGLLNFFVGIPVLKNYNLNFEQIESLSNINSLVTNPYFLNFIESLSNINSLATNPYFSLSIGVIFYFLYSFIMLWKLIIDKPFFLCESGKNIGNINRLKNNFLIKYLIPLSDYFKLYYEIFLYNYLEPKIKPIESVKWSLNSAVKTLRRNLIPLSVLGVIVAIVTTTIFIPAIIIILIILLFNEVDGNIYILFQEPLHLLIVVVLGILGILISSLVLFLIISLYCAFAFVIAFGPMIFMLGGISIETSLEKTVFPNQGIWKSGKNIVVLSVLGIFWGSVIIIPMIWNFLIPVGIEQKPTLTIPELSYLAYYMLILIIPFALLGGGACIKHVVLRIILYFNGYIPWNYASFLNYASDRIFLRKVGGSYIFIHRMLQEHFADMNPN